MAQSGPEAPKRVAAFCHVALPRPVLQTFAYGIPAEWREIARPGMRVRVPFGRRRAVGCIERISAESGRNSVRDVLELLDSEPVFSPHLLQLTRWVADYYAAPFGLVLRSALPPGLLGAAPKNDPRRRIKVVKLTKRLPTLVSREEAFGRAARQRALYEQLEALGGECSLVHAQKVLGFGRGVVDGLVARDLAAISEAVFSRDPFAAEEAAADGSGVVGGRTSPSEAQRTVIAGLSALGASENPGVALLRGVTGSGKTLVYLELLEEARRRGRSGLVLVPEIALTPQTVRRFRERFADDVAVLHSGLSAGERHDEWLALRTGTKRVAIGTRSAVFAPVPDLGLIVVDEEHDGSYKQSETPRYHARAVAAMRARIEGALCVLGSATPCLETWHNAREGRYRLFELPDRVTEHALPAVELVDMKQVRKAALGTRFEREGPIILSPRLREAIGGRLERSEQSILLLNRRGYSTFLQCAECGFVWTCPSCNVSLTWHRRRGMLLCHHCGYEEPRPAACGQCGSDQVEYSGMGTEQVERRVGELFPAARILRMDVDTTGGKWAHREMLDRVRRREVDILLGTQMIAKGLDFPGVTLVGVINADVGLNLPDFRATERTFQLVSQVAGRAGRGAAPGQVIVQTMHPGHAALKAAIDHDYETFAEAELLDREGPGYPPHRRLANIVISGPNQEKVSDKAVELADWTAGVVGAAGRPPAVSLTGPAPCPIDRLRGRWRWHYLLRSDSAPALGELLRRTAWTQGQPGGGLRIEIDRDPEALL
ncbi:MAG: primosomal protein N' [Gemmatimonadota bacterium]